MSIYTGLRCDIVKDELCLNLYEQGLTLREIGERLGLSKERVRQRRRRQERRLRVWRTMARRGTEL